QLGFSRSGWCVDPRSFWSASGKTNRKVAQQLETSKVTETLWRCRFLAHGVSRKLIATFRIPTVTRNRWSGPPQRNRFSLKSNDFVNAFTEQHTHTRKSGSNAADIPKIVVPDPQSRYHGGPKAQIELGRPGPDETHEGNSACCFCI